MGRGSVLCGDEAEVLLAGLGRKRRDSYGPSAGDNLSTKTPEDTCQHTRNGRLPTKWEPVDKNQVRKSNSDPSGNGSLSKNDKQRPVKSGQQSYDMSSNKSQPVVWQQKEKAVFSSTRSERLSANERQQTTNEGRQSII